MEQQDWLGTLSGSPATLYTIFLPLNRNDGRRMQVEILHYASGLTRFSPGAGFWIDRSVKLCRDSVLMMQTVVPSDLETEAWLVRRAAEMVIVLEQHQMLVFAQPVWILESSSLHLPVSVRSEPRRMTGDGSKVNHLDVGGPHWWSTV